MNDLKSKTHPQSVQLPFTDQDAAVAVLYENEEWTRPLLDALDARGVGYDAINLANGSAIPANLNYRLVFNRVSPSAWTRGNGEAIEAARSWLAQLQAAGTPVINGADAFELELSKVAQHRLIHSLGLRVPHTVTLSDVSDFSRIPTDFGFPAILKPNTGGSGAGVRFVGSERELKKIQYSDSDLPRPSRPLLLQEFITSRDGDIVRMEFIGGEFLFAMRVFPENTFNLCPAEGCERDPLDTSQESSVRFVHEPNIGRAAIAEARSIVQASGLDVGGVEYIESRGGGRYFYDINSTSVYRSDIQAASGVDAMGRLMAFVERQAISAGRTDTLLAA